jgi:hypothetical protein
MMDVEEDLGDEAKPQSNPFGLGKLSKALSYRVLSRHLDFECIDHAKLWQNRKKDDFVFVEFLAQRHPLSVCFLIVGAEVAFFKDWLMIDLENICEGQAGP